MLSLNIFCLKWGNSQSIFMNDVVISTNYWRITLQATKQSLLTATHIPLYYILPHLV